MGRRARACIIYASAKTAPSCDVDPPAPLLPHLPRPDLVDLVRTLLVPGLTDAVSLCAQAGAGKTSFLVRDLVPAVPGWGWRCCYVELDRDPGTPGRSLLTALAEHRGATGLAGADCPAVPSRPAPASVQGALEDFTGLDDRPALLVLDGLEALAPAKHRPVVDVVRRAAKGRRLKLVLSSTSRAALGALVSGPGAPLATAPPAVPLRLPSLPGRFVDEMGLAYAGMTRKRTDVDALHAVFERAGRIPAYLTLVVGHMARARTNDPWRGYALWREAEGRVRLDALWAGLRPLDRCILQHAAHGRHRIYGAGFAALATEAGFSRDTCKNAP